MDNNKIFRAEHEAVISLLSSLNSDFLEKLHCFFGGGTRIVLELDEYRISKDIVCLCSSQLGYRDLRQEITENSLGKIQKKRLVLARSVRADQYGIRTFVAPGQATLKFEIIREGRIDIEGETVKGIPVKCLSRKHCFAEKFMANADRGLDTSTLSRDLIDLAFMASSWPEDIAIGYDMATNAYGTSVQRSLSLAIEKLKSDKAHRNRCLEALEISQTNTLSKGLRKLSSLAQ